MASDLAIDRDAHHRSMVSLGLLYVAALLAVEGALAHLDWASIQGLAHIYGSEANIPAWARVGETMPRVRALAVESSVFGIGAILLAAAFLFGKAWARSVALVASVGLALTAAVIGFVWTSAAWRQGLLVLCCALYWWAYRCEVRKMEGRARRVPLFLWSVLGVAASSLLWALLLFSVEYRWPAYSGLAPDSELAWLPGYFVLGVVVLAAVSGAGRLLAGPVKSRQAALAIGGVCGSAQALAASWRLGVRVDDLALLLLLISIALGARLYLGRLVPRAGS